MKTQTTTKGVSHPEHKEDEEVEEEEELWRLYNEKMMIFIKIVIPCIFILEILFASSSFSFNSAVT